MIKEFVPYEPSLDMKELGFNEPCFGWFRSTLIPSNFTEYFLETEFGMNESPSDWVNSNFLDKACSAPLYQQSFRFFREKYNLDYEITYAGKKGEYKAFVEEYIYGNNGSSPSIFSYEEAELECLKKLIEIVKDENKRL